MTLKKSSWKKVEASRRRCEAMPERSRSSSVVSKGDVRASILPITSIIYPSSHKSAFFDKKSDQNEGKTGPKRELFFAFF